MADVTCVKCSTTFTRTCSCQGNICPACKAKARTARNASFRRPAKQPTTRNAYRVTFRDGRDPVVVDTPGEAAAIRAEARAAGVRTFMRTVRVPVEVESEAS